MKTCTMLDFMEEMKPWLDKDYIHSAYLEKSNRFVLQFLDGTHNVYSIDDCNKEQIDKLLRSFAEKGIKTPGFNHP
ncbi:MAG: hypothetical protein WBB23_14105 [Desulforhopalus sp.]